jgi:hypothetical protein
MAFFCEDKIFLAFINEDLRKNVLAIYTVISSTLVRLGGNVRAVLYKPSQINEMRSQR